MDWAEADSRKNSVVARRYGLKARAVVCKKSESYLLVIDNGESDFHEKLSRAKADPDWVCDIYVKVRRYKPNNILDRIVVEMRDTENR